MLGVHCGGELGNKMAEIRHNMVLVRAWRGIKVSRYFLLFPSLFAKTNLENNFVFFSGNEYSSNFAFLFSILKIGPCGSMIKHNILRRVISFNVEQSTHSFVEKMKLKLMRVEVSIPKSGQSAECCHSRCLGGTLQCDHICPKIEDISLVQWTSPVLESFVVILLNAFQLEKTKICTK